MKQVTTDKKLIAEALAPSTLIDVSDDGEKVRRNPDVPMPDNSLEFWNEIKTRTVYIKGFEPDTKLDDILDFLKPFGNVQNVIMRRIKDTKAFKGSIFATFNSVEEAKKVVDNEEAKTYKGKELERMMQPDYWAKEVAQTKEKREAKKALKEQKKVEAQLEEAQARGSATFIKGQILLAKNYPAEENIRAARDFFEKYGPVGFVEFNTEKGEAKVRFKSEEEDIAKKVLQKIQDSGEKVVFMDKELELSVLEGDDEAAYWANFNKQKALSHINQKNRQNRRGGYKQQRKGNRGRGDDKNGDDAEMNEESARSGGNQRNKRGRRARGDNDDENDEAKRIKVD